jgi:hypothetical protein
MDRTDTELRLQALQVTRMRAFSGSPSMGIELDAHGSPEALEVVQGFANASWLDDLAAPYLDDLLTLPAAAGQGSVSLREEGWATLEEGGQWVRVSNSHGETPCALVAWEEFSAAMRLKRRFLCLMRDCQGRGVPRYSIDEGFRVRLHAPG